MALIDGTLECVTDTGENRAFAVTGFDPANAALFAGALFQLSGLVAVAPPDYIPPERRDDDPPATVDPQIVGQWTATTADQRPATLLLYRAPDFDTTLLGRWLAQMQAG